MLSNIDRVLVVIGRTRHKMVVVELQEAVQRGAKFIELRLDYLAKAVDFKRLAPYKQCPWVATFRRSSDGGRYAGAETERQTVIRQAIVSGAFEWVDIETDIADSIRRFGQVQRIISYHNITETPANLEEIYERMTKQDGDVFKIAVTAQSTADVIRVMNLQRRAKRPTVAFCMGEIGKPSRFLALKFGAPFIYCAFNKDRGIAPGLPSYEELRTTYPVRSLGVDTKIFGVVGDPVSHSLSPLLHNHVYRKLGINAFYLPFLVPRGTFAEAIRDYDQIPIQGYSVTIPHKESAAKLAREAEPNVAITRAANTLIRREDGHFLASNTDYVAVQECLHAHLAERLKAGADENLSQLRFLVLGAGGVARAVVHAIQKVGGQVTIANRTAERAQSLAAEAGCKYVDWQARHSVGFDVLVNCTSIGMHPNVDESPVHFSILHPGVIVFDTIYTPETTLLIREAKARGCDTITGVEMFVRQAARQVELFTGLEPSFDFMRTILRRALSPVQRPEIEKDSQTSLASESSTPSIAVQNGSELKQQ